MTDVLTAAGRIAVVVLSAAPSLRRMLEKDVRSGSMVCRVAADPDGLRSVLNDWVPEVVVLDPTPNPGPDDWLERLKRELPGVPIVVVVGREFEGWAKDRAARGEIAAVILRPWHSADLLERIAEVQFSRRGPARVEPAEETTALGSELDSDLSAGVSVSALKDPAEAMLPFFRDLTSTFAFARGAHGRRVASLLWHFAEHLKLAPSSVRQLSLAGLVHDIGELELPEAARQRPEHELAGPELDAFRQHPERGARMLQHLPGLAEAARAVRAHHERFDGQGFPDGLKGEAIPLTARLLAVVDRFDEATNGGMFPARLSVTDALAFLAEERARRFDPRVVRSFLHWHRSRTAAAAEQNTAGTMTLSQMRPGMKLAKELRSADGILLVPAGHRLSVALLQRLHRLDAAERDRLRAEVNRD